MSCPECGRPVPPQGLKLCPHCGYPLLLDRQEPVQEEQRKIVHKPIGAATQVDSPLAPVGYVAPQQHAPVQYAPPQQTRALGPHCPSCGQVNPPHRKRCEICSQELWPGAAFPGRWMPAPPAVGPAPKRRSSWWKLALLIAIPLVLMATVWTLAYFL